MQREICIIKIYFGFARDSRNPKILSQIDRKLINVDSAQLFRNPRSFVIFDDEY